MGERKQECLLKIEHANKNVNTTWGGREEKRTERNVFLELFNYPRLSGRPSSLTLVSVQKYTDMYKKYKYKSSASKGDQCYSAANLLYNMKPERVHFRRGQLGIITSHLWTKWPSDERKATFMAQAFNLLILIFSIIHTGWVLNHIAIAPVKSWQH